MRYTESQRIGSEGERQFASLVEGLGWCFFKRQPDVGEDAHVDVYEDGEFSGVTFFAQVKSCENSQRGEAPVKRRLEVKDLVYWERRLGPLFVVAWSTADAGGYWIDAHGCCRVLDATSPGWRSQKTKTITFPAENTTDAGGMGRMREAAAARLLPLADWGSLTLRFSAAFDTRTPEGREKHAKFKEVLDEGGAITLDSANIQDLEVPPQLLRHWGPEAFEGGSICLESRPSPEPIPLRLVVERKDGRVEQLPYMELRCTQAGAVIQQFQTQSDGMPWTLALRLNRTNCETDISLHFRSVKCSVATALEAAQFADDLAEGGRVIIELSRHREQRLNVSWAQTGCYRPDTEFVELLRKASEVAERTDTPIFIPEGWPMSRAVEQEILEAYDVITNGWLETDAMDFSIWVGPDAVRRLAEQGGTPAVALEIGGRRDAEIWDSLVPLGDLTLRAEGQVVASNRELEQLACDAEVTGSARLRVVGAKARAVYSNWYDESADHPPGQFRTAWQLSSDSLPLASG